MAKEPEHLRQGALRQSDGSVHWRVWAPFSENVKLVLYLPDGNREVEMTAADFGYFEYRRPRCEEALRYALKLSDDNEYPDPASLWQPDGVHRPSAVFSPDSYKWSDKDWRGVSREDLVLYELHVGTFTPDGTFAAIIPRFEQLLSLGVTAIEIMPLAQFSGERNWGYDGVHPFAVQNSYGGPRAFQQLVDVAHRCGLAVYLDVVYNHFGPEGNYLAKFGPYFTDCYHTPWGKAVNYDGPDSDPVRQFVIDNACMWVGDFHVDGLRLDAVQTIYDFSSIHILADIKAAVNRVAESQGRTVHVIAETNQNDVRLINSPELGGYDLDCVWSDDFHHSVHSFLTGQRDGYYKDFGRAEDIEKAFNQVFVYNGCYSSYHRRRQGSRVGDMDRTKFVICIQNHDQIGNRAKGDRLSTILSPSAQRLACAFLLLSPCIPLLFMGEEYGEQKPFPFFCSFSDHDLIEAVRRGRREEFAALRFAWETEIPDAQDLATFMSAKLTWSWPEGSSRALRRRFYQDLLSARRKWPALRDRRHTAARLMGGLDADGNRGESNVLILYRGGENGLVAVANLSAKSISFPTLELAGKQAILSTEDVIYEGNRSGLQSVESLLPYEMLIFAESGRQS